MKKITLKEAFMLQEDHPGEMGPEPILSDYKSLDQVFQAMRRKVIEALKRGDHEGATAAIKESVLQGARYGYVTGWDKAWTQADQEDSGRR